MGGFALLALTLAAAGIQGVVSHGVLRRSRELSVRLALGASPGSVAWLVVKSTLRQLLAGTVAGLAASWALARWIQSLLYGIPGHDPVSFSLPPVVLVAVGTLASLLPMLRAARMDPVKSLREGQNLPGFWLLWQVKEEAIAQVREATRLAPGNAEAPRELARIYEELGRFPEAEASYLRATQARPTDWYGVRR